MLPRSLRHKPDLWIFAIGLALLVAHVLAQPQRLQQLLPVEIKQLTLSMTYEGDGDEINISTYTAQNSNRQTVIEQQVQAAPLDYRVEETEHGLLARWSGEDIGGVHTVSAQSSLALKGLRYDVARDLSIPTDYPSAFQQYLQATDAIQVRHPEIVALWEEIKPEDKNNLHDVLRTIYDFTHRDLETVPFKGLTDAVTALRLGQASCNGKSRVFVALARLNNIPARLVGGIVLDAGQKKTSHQWLEVYIERHWVPFGPTNGYFAELPANYLELYRGDRVLFSHTRNINFDYQFDIRGKRIATGVQTALTTPQQADRFNLMVMLAALGLDEQTASIFLLFPLCALCITFFRNVVGLHSFGIFMPMLVAAACRYTGIVLGLTAFCAVMLVAFIMHRWLEKARLLKIPRLAAVITVVTLGFLVFIASLDLSQNRLQLGIVALFPVVIIAFTAERLQHMVEDNDWREALLTSIGTLALILLCYLLFSSLLLRGGFALYPQLFIVVLALQIFIGRWTGVRVGEFWRFGDLIRHGRGDIMSLNARNRDWVLGKNDKQWMQVANNKLQTKDQLQQFFIPVPETLLRYDNRLDSQTVREDIQDLHTFVVKPNQGSRGQGILVLSGKSDKGWFDPDGKLFTANDIARHVQEILSGTYIANGKNDAAFIEPLIRQHIALDKVCDLGLSDIRIVLGQGNPIACMWRVPTRESHGKANLHQGAIGVSVGIDSGRGLRAEHHGKVISKHPNSGIDLAGVELPYWSEIITIAKRCYRAVPLAYLGVDICIDVERGPLVLEINARPGLEIQNVKDRGLRDLFLRFEGVSFESAVTNRGPAL